MSLHPPTAFPDEEREYADADAALAMLTQAHQRQTMAERCRYCGEPWPCTTALLARWVLLLRAQDKGRL
jgi:hypothetical protein